MKANELMLGDIITFKDSVETDETPITVKVIALGYQHNGYENEALVQIGDDETCDIVTIDDDFVGYPLTSEILEKNGFKPDTAEDAYKYCYRIDSVSIVEWYANAGGRYRGIISFGDTRLRITLMFVHQLQHALRLCGIEKEIEL